MIEINLFWILTLIISVVIVFVVLIGFKNLLDNKKDIHFKDKDILITSDLIAKYPNVSPDFRNKTLMEQSIENNQELHEKDIEIDIIKKRLDLIEETIRINTKSIMELRENG